MFTLLGSSDLSLPSFLVKPRDVGTGVHTLQTGTRGVKEATRFARDAIAGVPVRFVFSVVRVQRLPAYLAQRRTLFPDSSINTDPSFHCLRPDCLPL